MGGRTACKQWNCSRRCCLTLLLARLLSLVHLCLCRNTPLFFIRMVKEESAPRVYIQHVQNETGNSKNAPQNPNESLASPHPLWGPMPTPQGLGSGTELKPPPPPPQPPDCQPFNIGA